MQLACDRPAARYRNSLVHTALSWDGHDCIAKGNTFVPSGAEDIRIELNSWPPWYVKLRA